MLIANVLVFGVAALVLILSPATVSASVTGREVLELAIGLALALLVNLAILRPAFRPLERLADSMRTADLLRPGERVASPAAARSPTSSGPSTRCSTGSRPSGARARGGHSWRRRTSGAGSRRSCTTRSGRR